MDQPRGEYLFEQLTLLKENMDVLKYFLTEF